MKEPIRELRCHYLMTCVYNKNIYIINVILKSGSMGQLVRVADGSSGTEARHELGSVSEYLYLIRVTLSVIMNCLQNHCYQ